MMGWMDKIAVLLAMEYTEKNCVTVFADQIRFIRPVNIREVVDLEAEIIEEGMTSLLIQVHAMKRKTIEKSHLSQLVAESVFKFVALNKEGKPTDQWEHQFQKKSYNDQQKDQGKFLSKL
jgi:acyl-CoA thioesterase YciA